MLQQCTSRPVTAWRRIGCWLALGLSVGLSGCASTEKQVGVPYAVHVAAAEEVNPDSNGRPSPIQITLFELRSSRQFDGQDYFSLMSDPQSSLAPDLMYTEQIVLSPGESKTFHRPGSVDARVVGIIAGYQDLSASSWRKAITLPKPRGTNIYKVWQLSPDEQTLSVVAKRQGLEIVKDGRRAE